MKPLLLVFALLLIGLVSSQDVKIPGNLLEVTTTPSNPYVTTEAPIDLEVEEVDVPDGLRVVPRPPCAALPPIPSYYPSPPQQLPCEVVQPTRPEYYQPEQIQPPTRPEYYPPEQIQTIRPIIDTRYDPPEVEEMRLCPIGKVQNGSVCVDVYADHECPQGYTWKNDRCVLSRTTCPLNFEWDGRSCVQRRICPINHIWKNDRCVLPVPECPQGWSWNGAVCEVDKITCPLGSVVRGHQCVDESFTCPPGFIEQNEECIKPLPICPPGYEYTSESGFCTQKNLRCRPGSQRVNGECETIVVKCPLGTYKVGNQCYNVTTPIYPYPVPTTPRPSVTVPTKRPSHPWTCPSGFVLYNNLCYRCPQSYNLCNNQCVRQSYCDQVPQPAPPAVPHYPSPLPVININLYSRESAPSTGHGRHVVTHLQPINNTIVNINNITHPITLNNVNENNFYIYTDTQCADGSIRTVVIKNNETVNGCVDVNPDSDSGRNSNGRPKRPPQAEPENDREDNEVGHDKCCEIVTPRQCRKKNEDQWKCSHKRYKYCGNFCIADRLYLKPPATSYNNNVLTIAPAPNVPAQSPCFGRNCPSFDCSGCMNGSFNCSNQCYTYPCNHSECHYLDQDDFCGAVGGQICERR